MYFGPHQTTVLQENTTGDLTEAVLVGLTPYTSYTCTLHAVTVSDGPNTDAMTITTAEEGSIKYIYTESSMYIL